MDRTTLNRAIIIDQQFSRRVRAGHFPQSPSKTTPEEAGLSPKDCIGLFQSQVYSRHLDFCARQLREKNQSFYTIGSSGHEGNAAIALVFALTDMAFLHYRSQAFMIERAKKHSKINTNILRDLLFSITSSSLDPISGGRHKVLGSFPLYIPPQTSTIASHLPKALGTAFSIPLAKDLKTNSFLPYDSVVLCSFGDASVNHSTACGTFNAAHWITRHQLPLPLVFICEDNGLGISVPTPKNWIEENFKNYPGLHYIAADGLNFCDVTLAARKAETIARIKKLPVFLHFKTVRLLGHAGSDIEFHYHSLNEIESIEAEDPLLHSARILIENDIMSAEEILETYEQIRNEIKDLSLEAIAAPKLCSKEEIVSTILPPKKNGSEKKHGSEKKNESLKNSDLSKKTLAQSLNQVLQETLTQYKQALIFGEDVGKKGGVYRITANLQTQFGIKRVFDTLLDEQTILGLSIGLAHNHFLPIPEIQFLAFLHNAEDQLRGEAATLSFFSNGQFTNPMVLRLPGLAYQKGFGGHFHNDNAIAFLREIPGLIIACPSHPKTAVKLFRECVRLAVEEKCIVVFLEPIALYHIKDLTQKEDNEWMALYPDQTEKENLPFGQPEIYGQGKDMVIFTYGNGYYLSRQAEKKLKEGGIELTIIDLCWLTPLNKPVIIEIAKSFQKILIVDECRERGSLSEEMMTLLTENIQPLPDIQRIVAANSFIPLGPAAELLLPSLEEICNTVRSMLQKKPGISSHT